MRRHGDARRTARRRRQSTLLLLISLLVLIGGSVGGVLAWITASDNAVENTFTSARVTSEIEETFDGEVKKDVAIRNTGDTDAYIRVRLVSHRQNAAGQIIGGAAPIGSITPPDGAWFLYGGYYYYTQPVAPGALTGILIDEYVLEDDYGDGESQVLEVLAEAVQSNLPKAVGEAWGVTINVGNVSAYAP